MTKKQIYEKIFLILQKNKKTISNLNNIDSNIEIGDCYMYVIDKINTEKYLNSECDVSLLNIEVFKKLINYFNKIRDDKYLELLFDKHCRCVANEFSNLSYEEKNILLYIINSRFKRFIDLSFLTRNDSRYRKKHIKSMQNKYATDDILDYYNNIYEEKRYNLFSYKKESISQHLNKEKDD